MATKKVNVTLTPERVSLGPGETAEFVATIHNTSDVVEAYSVDVQGIDPAWSKLSVTSLSLFPGDKETVRIQVTPPISSSAKAGSYPVSVRVISKRDPAIGTIASFILDLGKISDYNLELLPRKITGRKGSYQLAITNNGNTVSTYKLEAFDPEDVCHFRFKSDTVAVDPGTTKKTPLVVNPKKKPFTGAPKTFDFSVKSMPLEGEPKEVDGELLCRALLPKWAVAAICIGVVALLVLIVVLITTTGGGLALPINKRFQLAHNASKSYVFNASEAQTIVAKVDASSSNRLSLLLRGPNGKERQRQEGSSPLSLSYTITDNDLADGTKWRIDVANLSDASRVTGIVHVELKGQ